MKNHDDVLRNKLSIVKLVIVKGDIFICQFRTRVFVIPTNGNYFGERMRFFNHSNLILLKNYDDVLRNKLSMVKLVIVKGDIFICQFRTRAYII